MHAGPVRRAAGAALAGGVVLVGYAALVRAAAPALGRQRPGGRRAVCPATRWSPSPATRPPTPSPSTPHPARSGRGWSSWARVAGLYSYDWLENLFGLGFRSADRILPELQTLQVGDQVWLAPRDSAVPLWYQVLDVQPPQALVLGPHGDRQEALAQGLPWPTWTFVLRDLGNGSSRLLVRMRSDFKPTLLGLLANKYGLEPVHFAMERKMLLGIKERAERAAVT